MKEYRITFRSEIFVKAESKEGAEKMIRNTPSLFKKNIEENYDASFVEIEEIEEINFVKSILFINFARKRKEQLWNKARDLQFEIV